MKTRSRCWKNRQQAYRLLIGEYRQLVVLCIACRQVGSHRVCSVEPENRRAGVAAKLVSAAEDWFRQKEVGGVELPYMVKNELATVSWQRLGYQPFRVFAYKEL